MKKVVFGAKTYFLFPVDMDGVESASDDKCKNEDPIKLDPKAGSRGVSMIIAIMIVAMMLIFSADMIINSAVSVQLATTHRDNVKSEYMAKSALNLGVFMITADWGIDLAKFQGNLGDPSDGPGDVWTMLNWTKEMGMPIGKSTVEMIASDKAFNLNKVNDSKVIDQLALFDGEFSLRVEDEGSKINVNYCSQGRRADRCLAMLEALMSCPAEKEFLSKKKLRPKEVAGNIKDWVDLNKKAEEGWVEHSSESDPYDDRSPKVKPKNAPFDSLNELRIVDGWDDDMHTVFAPYLTVYPIPNENYTYPAVNFNSANRSFLGCILPNAREGDFATNLINEKDPAKESDRPENASSLKDINARLSKIAGGNIKEVKKWFTYRSDIYRVYAYGGIAGHERVIESVVHRRMPTQKEKKDNIKTSYKYLQWKML